MKASLHGGGDVFLGGRCTAVLGGPHVFLDAPSPVQIEPSVGKVRTRPTSAPAGGRSRNVASTSWHSAIKVASSCDSDSVAKESVSSDISRSVSTSSIEQGNSNYREADMSIRERRAKAEAKVLQLRYDLREHGVAHYTSRGNHRRIQADSRLIFELERALGWGEERTKILKDLLAPCRQEPEDPFEESQRLKSLICELAGTLDSGLDAEARLHHSRKDLHRAKFELHKGRQRCASLSAVNRSLEEENRVLRMEWRGREQPMAVFDDSRLRAMLSRLELQAADVSADKGASGARDTSSGARLQRTLVDLLRQRGRLALKRDKATSSRTVAANRVASLKRERRRIRETLNSSEGTLESQTAAS